MYTSMHWRLYCGNWFCEVHIWRHTALRSLRECVMAVARHSIYDQLLLRNNKSVTWLCVYRKLWSYIAPVAAFLRLRDVYRNMCIHNMIYGFIDIIIPVGLSIIYKQLNVSFIHTHTPTRTPTHTPTHTRARVRTHTQTHTHIPDVAMK